MTRHAKLGRFINIRTGYLSRTKVQEAPNGRYALIQLSDFDDTRTTMNPDTLTRFEPGDLRKDQTIQPGEVLFLAKGVHNFAYHPGPLPVPTLAASYFYVLTPAPEVTPRFLTWFLNHPHTRRAFDRIAGVGARMPVVKKSDLADIDIPVPPLADQHKIVELHALMTRESRLLEQLRQHRKTLIDTLTMAIAQGEQREDTHHA